MSEAAVDRQRWARIKQLVADAVPLPAVERARLLDSVCADDSALGREVAALLMAHDAAGDVFDRRTDAIAELAASALPLVANAAPLGRGDRIGPYEIVEPIGAGGMGQVFRAHDARLNREIALKILPPAALADPARRERFVQEARAASALEHPHIAVIHEIGEADGVTFIAMELLRGETLSEVLARGPLTLVRAIDIAIEIGEGLARAHEKAIVHRDIKPSNVMITEDGHAKIIDFGLAKLVEAPTGQSDQAETDPGMLLGTTSYMSPEQASGAAVDGRSDIFTLGVLLYEVLTGRSPFRGATRIDTLHAILHDPAPPLSFAIGDVADLQRILDRCLAKDPADRYQGMRDVVADLRAARLRIESSQTHVVSARSPRRRRLTVGIAAAGAVAAIAAGVALTGRPSRPMPSDRSQWIQLTNLDFATQPALSRDGRMLAFIRGPGTFTTDGQVYLKMLPDGEPVALTDDTAMKMSPVFSPDGGRIAYTALDGESHWDTWIVPTIRGDARRWLRNASGLSWLDREHVLFSEIATGLYMGIRTATASGSQSRTVYFPPKPGMAHRSYRSPDGASVLVAEMVSAWRQCRIVPFDGSSTGRAIGPRGACTSGAWSPDGKTVFLTVNAGDGFHIWRQRLDGTPEQLTSGPMEDEGVAVAGDGRSIITSSGVQRRSVWVLDHGFERPISLEGYAYWPVLSADGRKVLYRITPSSASGQTPSELWMTDLDSGATERLFAGHLVNHYDVSNDGRIVAGVQDPGATPHVWTASLDGSIPPRPIPNAQGDNPLFGSPGEIAFRTAENGTFWLSRVHEDGTGLTRLLRLKTNVLGFASPDGKWVSCAPEDVPSLCSLRGEAPIAVFSAGSAVRLRWSRDGAWVYLSVQLMEASAFGIGRTYAIPLTRGALLPPMPKGGFRSEADLAAIPGVRVLQIGDLAPGPTPDSYAFSKTTITRNLYRIPLF